MLKIRPRCGVGSSALTEKRGNPARNVAYVTAVYEAQIIEGSPAPGDGELSEIAWFAPADLTGLPLSRFARALLRATDRL